MVMTAVPAYLRWLWEILGNALGRTAALSPAFATAYARNIVINNTPGE